MDNQIDILDNVAPCGLICYTCNGCDHGVVKELTTGLLHYLDGYDDFVQKSWPEDSKLISNCIGVLRHWADLDCPGCRHEDNQCQNQNCVVRSCTREKGYKFCAECTGFPCDKIQEEREFTDFWKAANAKIRDIGVEAYFEEQKSKSQYARFK